METDTTIENSDILVDSLGGILNKSIKLSWQITYETIAPDGCYFDPRKDAPDEVEGMSFSISAYADGLVYNYYRKRANGECSLRAMIDFDLEEFENEVIKDIGIMQNILIKIGLPRKMTNEEMIRRGYKGYDEKDKHEFMESDSN